MGGGIETRVLAIPFLFDPRTQEDTRALNTGAQHRVWQDPPDFRIGPAQGGDPPRGGGIHLTILGRISAGATQDKKPHTMRTRLCNKTIQQSSRQLFGTLWFVSDYCVCVCGWGGGELPSFCLQHMSGGTAGCVCIFQAQFEMARHGISRYREHHRKNGLRDVPCPGGGRGRMLSSVPTTCRTPAVSSAM